MKKLNNFIIFAIVFVLLPTMLTLVIVNNALNNNNYLNSSTIYYYAKLPNVIQVLCGIIIFTSLVMLRRNTREDGWQVGVPAVAGIIILQVPFLIPRLTNYVPFFKIPAMYYGIAEVFLTGMLFMIPRMQRRIRDIRNELLSLDKYRPVLEKLSEVYWKKENVIEQYKTVEHSLNRINDIYNSLTEINETLEIESMVSITHELLHMLEFQNYVLFIWNDKKKHFDRMRSHGLSHDMEQYQEYWRSTTTDINAIVGLDSPITQIDISHDLEFTRHNPHHLLKRANIITLKVGSELIGLIITFITHDLNNEQRNWLDVATMQLALGFRKTLLYQKVNELSQRDGLTKLLLHRVFKEKIDYEFNRAQRYHTNLVLLMLDIDHFKNFNDRYGHIIGDKVLQSVSKTIRELQSAEMMAARYGGEEFTVICPYFSLNNGYEFAETLRAAIENNKIIVNGIDDVLSVTVSIGVAAVDPLTKTFSELIANADKALYDAKNAGRNIVKLYQSPDTPSK